MVVYQSPGVELTDDDVDRIFRALADSTRRDILRRSLAGPLTVTELASSYAMSFAAVQKHVAVLEGAGLVTKEPNGRERLVNGNPEAIARAHGLITELEETASNSQKKAAADRDASDAAEGVDTVRMLSPIVQDADSYQDTRRSAEDAATRGPADIASEESTEQLLRVSQAPEVFLPNGQGGRLVVAPIPRTFAGFDDPLPIAP